MASTRSRVATPGQQPAGLGLADISTSWRQARWDPRCSGSRGGQHARGCVLAAFGCGRVSLSRSETLDLVMLIPDQRSSRLWDAPAIPSRRTTNLWGARDAAPPMGGHDLASPVTSASDWCLRNVNADIPVLVTTAASL